MGSTKNQPRVWQRMLSGRRLDLIDPSPLDIEIEDIAHGLARVARWNGQTRGKHAYSVAQHSLALIYIHEFLVAACTPIEKLYFLLHDAPEYVIGDIISPFKTALGPGYKTIEKNLQSATHLRFGLKASVPKNLAAQIKRADRVSAYYEATTFAGFSEEEAAVLFDLPEPLPEPMRSELFTPWPTDRAQKAYLDAFKHAETAAAQLR